jgi:hypothetical protein
VAKAAGLKLIKPLYGLKPNPIKYFSPRAEARGNSRSPRQFTKPEAIHEARGNSRSPRQFMKPEAIHEARTISLNPMLLKKITIYNEVLNSSALQGGGHKIMVLGFSPKCIRL